MESNERQPHPPEIFMEEFAPTLAKCNGEVVLLARVMVDVGCPKQSDFVASTVMNVKGEVFHEEQQNPSPPDIRNGK
jgi:hypothetical protein